jgi:hypothetical protein
MNRKLCCAMVAVLIGTASIAFAGPYSIFDDEIVRIDRGYQTMDPIGNDPHWFNAIEFSQDGYIYGVDHDTLMRTDPLTGETETVGPLGIDLQWDMDLDEDVDGQLWLLQGGTGKLFTIDRITGSANLQCQSSIPEVYGLVILDGRFVTTTYLTAPQDPGCGLETIYSPGTPYLEKGPDGSIHGLRYQPIPFQWTYAVFFRIDPTTGAHEELGRFFLGWSDMRGLTFDPTEQPLPAPIPALGWPGRALFTLMLALAGAVILAHPST